MVDLPMHSGPQPHGTPIQTSGAPAPIPVSVVVPVRNEERNLARCLAGLSAFSEVMVIDSGSTDATRAIAESFGAKVVQFRWDGRYPKKRNWVLTNCPPAHAWVLFLDADESVDDRFCSEVSAAVASGANAAYWLNYTNYFLGRQLRHGVPQRKLALLRVGAGLYERIDEESWSSLDMEVHEHPVVTGSVGTIRAPIEHNDFRGIDRFIDRHREYARWEARRFLALKDDTARHLTKRQSFKYRHIDRWWYPASYFIYAYGARLGFLDGAVGFQYAFYKAWYFATVRLLIREYRSSHLAGRGADGRAI